jgi:hypothetical protein
MRFSIRDLFWLTLAVAAFFSGWRAKEDYDNRQLERLIANGGLIAEGISGYDRRIMDRPNFAELQELFDPAKLKADLDRPITEPVEGRLPVR